MQSSSVTLTCGSHVISSTTAYVIRGMINSMAITLLDDAGTALDITDVSTWDLGITEDFFGETGVLAGSSTITATENVLAVTMNGHTKELASLMDGKKSIQAYATLRGRDASDVINRLYVFPVVILNIGFTNDTILTTAAQELTYTKAQIDYLLSQLPGGTGAEKIENKTQEIDTEEPSAEKYPSEAAAVTYVSGQVSSLNTAISGKVDKEAGKVLSDNNFTTAEKNKLESALTSVPDASTAVKGVVQIATGEEVTAGTDDKKAIVPATLKTELDKKANTSAIPDITGKVDKVEGKDLSTNDFTDAYKTKVDADVESVTALPSPAVSLLSRVYFLTADDGTKKKGTTWKCVADGESYVFQQIQTDLNQLTDTTGILAGKVDKVTGYGLSKNDYTDADAAKVAAALTSVPDASTSTKGIIQLATGAEVTAGTDTAKAVVPSTLKTELDKKVDKVEGKDLSTNDFTDAYKTKVDADVESVTALPSPAVSLLSRVYFLTADDGTKKKGTTWKCVADGESYVFQQIQTDLNQLTDTTGILAGKVDKVTGYGLSKNDYTDADAAKVAAALTSVPDASTSTKGIIQLATGAEVTAGTDTAKAVVPSTLKTELDKKVDKVAGKGLSTNDYDNTEKAKVGKIELETLAELTGANVTIAPWTQSKWSASGVCSLTASGWAASGHQIAYIVITLAAEATLSISGTEEVAEDDALIAAGVYECYIKNVDGKKYFRVISFTEAAS